MAEIGRNINGAFEKGRQRYYANGSMSDNPYKVPHMRNAWDSGFRQERAKMAAESAVDQANSP